MDGCGSIGTLEERIDYEYERNGTANLFMVFEPLVGRQRAKVTDRRTAIDFAEVIREIVDSHPTADKIVLITGLLEPRD